MFSTLYELSFCATSFFEFFKYKGKMFTQLQTAELPHIISWNFSKCFQNTIHIHPKDGKTSTKAMTVTNYTELCPVAFSFTDLNPWIITGLNTSTI